MVESPYGLRGWLRWATARKGSELACDDLPKREWPRPTDAQRLKAENRPGFLRLEPGVAENRLHNFSLMAGWTEREDQIDWATEDLRRLVDPKRMLRFGRYLARGRDGCSLASGISFSLATLASPFLEAKALAQGDTELADQMRDAASDLKVQGKDWQDKDGPKDIWRIESLWDGGKDRGGWPRLLQLRNLMIEKAEQRAGMSIQEQITHIRNGGAPFGATWAVAIRMAVLITLIRTVPLRGRSLAELTLDMWQSRPAGPWSAGVPLEPWQGGIYVECPTHVMKSKRVFVAPLSQMKSVGDKARERVLRRDVLELYFMAGGARYEILSVCEHALQKDKRVVTDRTVYESIYVFPAMARRGGGHGTEHQDRVKKQFRWDEGALSTHFSDTVLRYAAELGLDRAALEAEWGATSIHVIRLLFGTYWAGRKGKLVQASVMLGHASVSITADKYVAKDAGELDLEAEEGRLNDYRGLDFLIDDSSDILFWGLPEFDVEAEIKRCAEIMAEQMYNERMAQGWPRHRLELSERAAG